MSVTNLYDLNKTRPLPSPQFLHRKKQSSLNRLVREILMKEYQFRNCKDFDEHIEKVIFEKELGELYAELMKPFKDAQNISGL